MSGDERGRGDPDDEVRNDASTGYDSGSAEHRQWRDAVAGQWATEVSATIYIPMSREDLEGYLRELVELLGTAVEAEGDPVRIEESGTLSRTVGERLVHANLNGEQSLHRSLQVLGPALLAGPVDRPVEEFAARVISVLGAVVTGYVEAMRESMFSQQESVTRALLRSKEHTERQLQVSETRFREVFTAAPMGIAITDLDGKFVETNAAFTDLLDCGGAELDDRVLGDLFHEDSVRELAAAYRDLATGQRQRYHNQKAQLRRPDGGELDTSLAVAQLHDADGTPSYHVTMIADVSDLRLLQMQFEHQSLHDEQTGLPNRTHFLTRLETALAASDSRQLTLFHLDLDGFGVVNEGMGHAAGDRLLQAVARRLTLLVAEEPDKLVARFGADEFVVLIRENESTPDVASLAESMNEVLAEPLYVGEHGLAATAGIGIVREPRGALTASETVRAAESALRTAKTSGKRQWALYDAAKASRERVKSALASVLPGALENGEVEVAYQPMYTPDVRMPVGVEVLVEWSPADHPDGSSAEPDSDVAAEEQLAGAFRDIAEHGPVDHATVLELAERTGTTLPMRDWAMRAACRDVLEWQTDGDGPPVVTMNLSRFQASDPDLVGSVRSVLIDTGMPPERLWLSLPTPTVLDARTDTAEHLVTLDGLGVRVGLHDFGMSTGDLLLLEELPVRTIRVADEVAAGMVRAADATAVRAVSALVPLIKESGYTLLVGCVDTEEQARWWQSLGVDYVLGDLLHPAAKPVEVAELFG